MGERTSFWYWLSDWCTDNDSALPLAHAQMVKAISYGKVKTDKVDAKPLAELLRADLIPEAHQASRRRRELRELTRGRFRMIQRRSNLQSTRWNQAATYNGNRGAHGWGEQTILAEIGDITRFPSAKQFVSDCRLVPGASDRGGHHPKSGSKEGNTYRRAALGQAVVCGYPHYKGVKDFYRKIKHRSGKPVARTVVGKQLAKGVWHRLTKDEEYNGVNGQPIRTASNGCWPQPISPLA